MHQKQWISLAAAVGVLVAPSLPAAQLQLSTGVEYSRGDYDELTPTEALIVPFSARLSFGSLSLRASVPWMSLRGPADISPIIDDSAGGSSGSNTSGSNSGSGSGGSSGSSGSGSSGGSDHIDDFPDNRDVSGLGDATLSATWGFRDLAGTRLYVDMTGRVRLPTGNDAKGLGRGSTDFAALSELGWDGLRGGVFLAAGRVFQESGGTSPRRDVWQLSGGYWRNIGRRSVFGMQGNWRQASASGNPNPQSIEAFLVRGLWGGWRLEVSGGAGLSSASADYAAGLRFSWKSGRR